MKKYYKLEENGRITACSYMGLEGFILLEEPPFENALWDGDKWTLDIEKQAIMEASLAQKELIDIDIASIRSIREYINTLETCPKQLKDHEKNAKEKRKKITDLNKKQKKK